jgi:hypothetical protein
VVRKISAEILATLPRQQLLEDGTLVLTEADIKEFVDKAFRERDTRWLTNGRAMLHLLAYTISEMKMELVIGCSLLNS